MITGRHSRLCLGLSGGESRERPCCLPGRSRCGGQVGPLALLLLLFLLERSVPQLPWEGVPVRCPGRGGPRRDRDLRDLETLEAVALPPRAHGRLSACAVGVLGPWRAPACLARRASSPNRILDFFAFFIFSKYEYEKGSGSRLPIFIRPGPRPQKGAVPSLAAGLVLVYTANSFRRHKGQLLQAVIRFDRARSTPWRQPGGPEAGRPFPSSRISSLAPRPGPATLQMCLVFQV